MYVCKCVHTRFARVCVIRMDDGCESAAEDDEYVCVNAGCESAMEDDEYASEETFGPFGNHESAVATSLTRAELLVLTDRLVSDLCEVVSVSSDQAFVLLSRFEWDVQRVETAWFDDLDDGAGLVKKYGVFLCSWTESEGGVCPLCFDLHSQLYIFGCGHGACESCWRMYLQVKISEGQISVNCRCFGLKCPTIFPLSFCRKLTIGTLFWEKFGDWRVNDFVSVFVRARWCVEPACDLAIVAPFGPRAVDVVCTGCSAKFCWGCTVGESHVPVLCVDAERWLEKNSSESENVSWILANTKPCPKCRRPIEKNQGCNHIVCRNGNCGTEFCWMCLQLWKVHGSGSFYNCNIYKENPTTGDDKIRKEAKNLLDRYMFFFSRFMNHEKGRAIAVQKPEITAITNALCDRFEISLNELQMLQIAMKQVVQSRQVLKWTYVYAFYKHPGPLFELAQKDLEEFTDRLHEFVEKDLAPYTQVDNAHTQADAQVDKHAGNLHTKGHTHVVTNDTHVHTHTLHTPSLSDLRDLLSRIANYANVIANFQTRIVSQFT